MISRKLALAAPAALVVGMALGQPPQKPAPHVVSGEGLFAARCASCHGAKGEGAAGYPRPLGGSRTASELTAYIAASMPPGEKRLRPADAKSVSGFVYAAFASPLARERRRPARVALSRLSVGQYRRTVADVLASLRGAPPTQAQADARGLRGEYFKGRDFGGGARLLARVDPQVRFDFGAAAPAAEGFQPHQFSIRWTGALLAPDTGEYELNVRSEHGVRLFLNDGDVPLIDGWVKSGDALDHRATIFLLGGRTYPLRLEFTKSTQGVDDTEKKKGKPPATASIALLWRRPKLPEEVVPARCLLPVDAPETLVVSAAFPPDDRSLGFERGASVSRAWEDAATSAALEAADYVAKNLRALSRVAPDAPEKERAEKLRLFSRRFVERALRRPLDPDAERLYIERPFQISATPEIAVKRVVLLALQSPRFLFREPQGVPEAYRTASRLSFALWDAPPDDALLAAASSGKLATSQGVREQAERLAADPRAASKLRGFFLQWLKVDAVPDLAKDRKRYPDFTPEAAADLRTSLELTLEKTLTSDRSDLRELLLSDRVFLNGRLARLYGANLPEDAPFQEVALDPGERAGILSHPYLLASLAYINGSSPIHRGVLLARNVFGRTLAPPPAAFVPLDAALHPNLTTRERVTLQTRPAACIGCHGLINPLGFTLERFDAIGRLRTSEGGKKIDCSGSYVGRGGSAVAFTGAPDLARYVAGSDEARSAFVEKLFQFSVQQPIRAYGPDTLPKLTKSFVENGFSIRKLSVEIAVRAGTMAP